MQIRIHFFGGAHEKILSVFSAYGILFVSAQPYTTAFLNIRSAAVRAFRCGKEGVTRCFGTPVWIVDCGGKPSSSRTRRQHRLCQGRRTEAVSFSASAAPPPPPPVTKTAILWMKTDGTGVANTQRSKGRHNFADISKAEQRYYMPRTKKRKFLMLRWRSRAKRDAVFISTTETKHRRRYGRGTKFVLSRAALKRASTTIFIWSMSRPKKKRT